MKDYFISELTSKLTLRFSDDCVSNAINYMQEKGYLDDEKLAYRYALSKLNQGYGALYILSKLQVKGVCKDEAFIASIIESEDINFNEYVKKTVERCIKRYEKRELENKEYRAYLAAINHLLGRGFVLDDIKQWVDLSAFASLKDKKINKIRR